MKYLSQSEEHVLLRKLFSLLIDISKSKNAESQGLMAARNCIDAIVLKISNHITNDICSPSKIFAEKLTSSWGDHFVESGATSGRLGKPGGRERSTQFMAQYGKTYVRSLSN